MSRTIHSLTIHSLIALSLALAPEAAAHTTASGSSGGSWHVASCGQDVYIALNDHPVASLAAGHEVTVNGNIVLSLLDLEACTELDSGCDATARLENTIRADVALEVRSSAAMSFAGETYPLLLALPPITHTGIYVAPLVVLRVHASGDATANLVASTVQQFELTAGVSIDATGVKAYADPPERTDQFSPPTLTNGSGLRLTAGADLAVFFQIIPSAAPPLGAPYVIASARADLAVEPASDPWWDLDATVETSAGWLLPPFGALGHTVLSSETKDVLDAGGPIAGLDRSAARWSRAYDFLGKVDTARALTVTDDGRVLVAGDAAGAANRAFLMELGPHGEPTWEWLGDQGTQERPTALAATDDGGSVVVGNRLTTGEAYVARYDVAGRPLWSRQLSDSSTFTVATDVAVLANGDLLCVGRAGLPGLGRPLVARLDGNGRPQELRFFESSTGDFEGRLNAVEALPDGGAVVVGRMDYREGGADSSLKGQNALVARFDADLEPLWVRVVGGVGTDEATAVTRTAEGAFVVAGHVDHEAHSAWMFCLDGDGAELWSRTFAGTETTGGILAPGDSAWDTFTDLEAGDGGVVAVGTTSLGADKDAWLLKVDELGRVVWWKSYRGGAEDELVDVALVDDGLFAVGSSRSFPSGTGSGNEDAWVVRTAFDGMLHFAGPHGTDVMNDRRAERCTALVRALDIPGQWRPLWVAASALDTDGAAGAAQAALLTE